MVLACNNICKSFGDNMILNNCSFHIEDREKAAIVGLNGAGKSTLLKIIMGELSKDSGEIIIGNGKTLGYLSQHQDLSTDLTIYQEMLTAKQEIIELESKIHHLEMEMKNVEESKLEDLLKTYNRCLHEFEINDGYTYKSEIVGVIKGLGFKENEFTLPIKTLSGGQKTRVSLGKLLLLKPEIILLDEPINHLDMQSINWLENYLMNYKGSVIIVAHDRYFLDRVVTKIIEIDQSVTTTFMGNYSAYSYKKAALMDAKIKQYYNQQKEIKAQTQVIEKLRSFNREKSIKRAESREKLLNKMNVIEKPITEQKHMSFELEPNIISGKDVLQLTDVSKSFEEKQLFSKINVEIKRGERVAIIGNNGTGKTTLLKIINKIIECDEGTITLGSKVNIGYYDQEHHILDVNKTIIEEISDCYPMLNTTKIRNVLAAFMFTGDDVFKQIKALSGGERGRVSLAKLMLSEANFLILDEPTNHLDIMSKEILENALNNYSGTILYVSHDRFFINKTATRILELTNCTFVNYIGNYDYYMEKKDYSSTIVNSQESKELQNNQTSKNDWAVQKEQQAKERKRQNDLRKTEDRISELEERNKELDDLLLENTIFSDNQKLMDIYKERELNIEELNKLFEKWENLM